MLKEAIQKVVNGTNLQEEEMEAVMDAIMSGEATPAQIGAFITALRLKGETVEEITAAARVMRRKATHIKADDALVTMDRDDINLDLETVIDTCGTGGDGTNTFNVSTTTAFVVAGCGLRVAKHGNRSVSSQCGSADVIESLGVNLDVPPAVVEKCLNERYPFHIQHPGTPHQPGGGKCPGSWRLPEEVDACSGRGSKQAGFAQCLRGIRGR